MQAKWQDSDDELRVDLPQAKTIVKKIARKTSKISEGLRDFHDKLAPSNFVSWTSKRQKVEASKAQALLSSAALLENSKKEGVQIKKLAQTDPADFLGSVVQSVDAREGRFAFAGFDKVVKVLKLDPKSAKNYAVEKAICLAGLPITKAKLLDGDKALCAYERKEFVGFLDLAREKSTAIYKLFDEPKTLVEGFALSSDRKLALVFGGRQTCLLDSRTQQVVSASAQPQPLRDVAFIGEQEFCAAFADRKLRTFDLRKGISLIQSQVQGDFTRLASNGDRLLCGGKSGLVKLFSVRGGLTHEKEFHNLSTDISFVDMSQNLGLFGTAWARNGLRIIDLSTLHVLKSWPNVKTNLGTIKAASFSAEGDSLLTGNSLGSLSIYKLWDE